MESNKILNFIIRTSAGVIFFGLVVSIIIFNINPAFPKTIVQDFLSSEERIWLQQHYGNIRVAPDPYYPPVDFFDKEGHFRGISADYLKLIEEKLGINFQIVRLESFRETLEKARLGEVDILNAVIKTPERSEYLLFTPPYISISNVMVVRNDLKQTLTIQDLKGISNIVYQKGYAIGSFLQEQGITHAKPVIDPADALHDLSMGRINVMVGSLAIISYYVREMKIPNLRVAGNSGFDDVLSFGIRKDLPMLKQIMEKAIMEITPEEHDEIIKKWLILKVDKTYLDRRFLFGLLGVLVFVLMVMSMLYLWNRTLKRQVAAKTSELRQREEALSKSREQYRLIAENTADVITVMDLNWKKNYVSPSILSLRGYTVEEALQQPIEEILTPESLKKSFRILEEELAVEKEENADPNRSRMVELEHYRKDGTTVWVENKMTFIRDEEQKPVAILVVSRDITERRKSEEVLRESEARFRALALSLNEGILIVDNNRRIVFCNRAIGVISGYREDEITGKPAEMLWPLQYREINIRRTEEFLKRKYPQVDNTGESFLLSKAGEEIPVEVSTTHWKTGDNIFFGAVIRDISDRKKREEYDLLKRKFDSLEIFSGWLAHDMNNLLAGLFGFMELALDNAGDSDAVKNWIQKAFKSASDARDLIRRFMVMTTAFIPDKKAVSVADVIKKNINDSICPEIKFVFKCNEAISKIDADEEMIDSVIKAVIDNAKEAMPEGGKLEITADNVSIDDSAQKGVLVSQGDYVRIKVLDRGCGMDSVTRNRVFDPYFSTKERGATKGQGLSLPLAYSILRRHEGHIEIESEEGIGTEVTIWIPVFKKADERKIEQKLSSDAPVTKKVLVLDDEKILRDMMSTMLARMGIEHEVVSSGEEAVERYFHAMESGNPFGLVILDLTVKGGMGGVPTLKTIQRRNPSVKAVVISGYSDDPVITNYKEYGFCASLAKPFNLGDFEAIVNRVIGL